MDNDTNRQPVAETADAENSEPPTLLSLTTELLLLIVERLPAVSICRFGLVSRAAQEVAHADEVWSVLLDQVWPDAAAATSMVQRREEPALKGRIQQLAAAALGLVQRRSVEDPAPKGCMQQFAALSYSPYPEVRAVGPELTWKDSAQSEIRFGQTSRVAASATSCAWGLCHGSLLLDSTPPRRCICVPTRSKLPLRIASLSRERAGSSSFDQGGFSHMLRTLRACYDVEGTREHGTEHADLSITSLRAELLAPLDVLVLCTTEGPALSEPELAALRSWVEAGGALIVSAFSNWSAHNHFAAQTVGWLGLQTMPLASFGGITVSSFEPHARAVGPQKDDRGAPGPQKDDRGAHGAHTHALGPAVDAETSALLDFTRFGLSKDGVCLPSSEQPRRGALVRRDLRFVNCGETPFRVLDQAFDAGAVQLVVNEGRPGSPLELALLSQHVAKLVFYPPRPTTEGGVTGRGRVLVCSNYHWMADPSHWMGGTLFEGANLPLLHNFIAGAVAARA